MVALCPSVGLYTQVVKTWLLVQTLLITFASSLDPDQGLKGLVFMIYTVCIRKCFFVQQEKDLNFEFY